MSFQGVDYYNIDELLTDEEKMLRQSVRKLLEDECEAGIGDAFNKEEPLNMRELAPKFGKLGLIGPFIPASRSSVASSRSTNAFSSAASRSSTKIGNDTFKGNGS